jgi:hypothetical protein
MRDTFFSSLDSRTKKCYMYRRRCSVEKTKLTIRVSRALIDGAKRYASENDTTLTRLIAEYLRRLGAQSDPLSDAPIVQRLSGRLSQDVSVEDYWEHLEKKYSRQA